MASSSDRDKDPDGSLPKTENPFIRFRQFADSQISSLLQSIIGLPSAFSKTPPSNARWAEFDDKLQRRDELKEQSTQVDKSGAPEGKHGGMADDEVEINVRKYPGWGNYSPAKGDHESNNQKGDVSAERDLPLYSPVSISLFSHLNGTEISLDRMRSLQYMMLNQLKAGSSFQSDYSLLPYLLFSPYSPLKLSSSPTSTTNKRGNLPYCDAFEDLIRVSQGRPMATVWTRVGLLNPWLFHHPTPYAASCMEWIRGMQFNGLLQQGIKPIELQSLDPRELARQIGTTASYPSSPSLQRHTTNSGSQCPGGDEETNEAETEQDMYERFLQMTSSHAGLGSMMESLLADAEKEFRAIIPPTSLFPEVDKKLKDLESSAGRLSFQELFSDVEKDIKSLTPQEARRAREHILKDTDKVLAAALASEDRRELRAACSDKKESRNVSTPAKVGPETTFDPDKVVSSSTTTEHTKNEDGSIETSVTVWKRFADGRESMTTSTHTEDPWSEEPPNKENKEEERKQEKKGWFWN